MTRRRGGRVAVVWSILVAVVALATLASCGGGNGSAGSTSSSPLPTSAPPASTSTTSAPVAGSGFLAFGDFGEGSEDQADVAAAMTAWAGRHRVDALVTTGDNVYPDGNPERFEAVLDEPYRALRDDRPLWVTLGNHDVQGGYGDEQLDHLGLPALPYARRLPGVELLFLDGNRPDAEQEAWLRNELSEPGPPFRVVVFHQPPYTCGQYADREFGTLEWVDTFEEYEVALVLTGHDHNYQRFRSPRDVHYVITGGGGRSIYPLAPTCDLPVEEQERQAVYHFVHVEVRGDRMVVRAVDTDGSVFDRAVIRRR